MLELSRTAEGLALEQGGQILQVDLDRTARRISPGGLQHELLRKAARIHRRAGSENTDSENIGAGNVGTGFWAIDATAGLGEDAFILAASGFQVDLYERDPVIAQLLQDTLRRAADSEDENLRLAAGRMTFHQEDSIAAMQELSSGSRRRPDVIFLDPMFPERRKSAKVGKKFQLLHLLEKPCEDEEELLEAALALRPRKVIIKRPPKGPYLAGRKPEYSLSGKAIRYDVFTFPED